MPPLPAWSCVLWDMDGTIADGSDAILRRLRLTLEHFDRPAVTPAELSRWIGPPMTDSFRDFVGMSQAEATEAVLFYRGIAKHEGYVAGIRLYPGVAEVIARLHADGMPQAIASSKPETQVLDIAQHFGLDGCFRAVVGASPDDIARSSKADVVAEALRRLEASGADASRPVLVGDRHHDIDGAGVHGVPVIFVRWGFGAPAEEDGAAAVVDDAAALQRLLLDPVDA